MKEIKIKTPSGKEMTVNENDETARSRISKDDKYVYLVVKHDGLNIVVAKEMENEVQNFYREIAIEKANLKTEELNKRIPGYTELSKAYDYRMEQIYISNAYMERGHRTSIFSGDKGKVREAEIRVNELEEQYPVAKLYIKWENADPASNYGFAANQAAEALYNGATLEEAERISKDWDIND